MTTLRVVVDQILSGAHRGISRYTQELTRELIVGAPEGCAVEGIVASRPQEKYDELLELLPGLAGLQKVQLRRGGLDKALPLGLGIPAGSRMIHAPSLLAPLRKHDRRSGGEQVVVTIHDVLPWTHPESLRPADVAWQKLMTRRARKHADAVVVPTHAVADQLGDLVDFGDRIRVIAGAPADGLVLPDDAHERAEKLGLPDRYALAMGSFDPRKALGTLLTAMARREVGDLPLLIVGASEHGDQTISAMVDAADLRQNRVRALGMLTDADLAIVYDRATVFVYPSLAEGFGLPVVEAFRFGTPVIHSDDPALVEVAGGAGIAVPREDAAGYPARLAEAIASVTMDGDLATRLSITGSDRGRAFSWRDSAERVWQLHADL